MSAPSEETTEDTAQGVREGMTLLRRRAPKSLVVWRYFGFLKSNTKQSSVHCKLCRAHVPTKTGNTTNLFHHLKPDWAQPGTSANLPPITRPVQQQQKTVESALSSAMQYDKKSKRHCDITNAVAYCIAKDMLPISTVENKRMLKVMDQKKYCDMTFSHIAQPFFIISFLFGMKFFKYFFI